MKIELDIIIPVYEEQDNILKTLLGLKNKLNLNYRILIVYDYELDPTLKIINLNFTDKNILLLKNKYNGLNGAVKTAFENSLSEAIVLYTAEDHQNFEVVNDMFKKFRLGYDIVCASRLANGGDYKLSKEPLLKKILVNMASFILRNFTNLATSDPTNGFRMFSKEVVKNISINSKYGFTFAIEILAKAYHLGYKITEVPSKSPIRNAGVSKFNFLTILFYLPWFFHIILFRPKK